MTRPTADSEPIDKLPFQVRPIAGEGCYPFVARLARANCLPPAYLRRFLAGPPRYQGRPSWARIAAVTGRDPEQLRKTLDTVKCKRCGSEFEVTRTFGVMPRYCSTRCRVPQKHQVMEPCRICRQPMKIQFGQRHRLCSSGCRRVAYIERRSREEDAADRQPFRDCAACEGPMPPTPQSADKRTCSETCELQVSRWDRLIERDGLPLPSRTCVFCGIPIEAKSLADPPRRWCSRRCRTWSSGGADPSIFFGPVSCGQCQKPIDRRKDGWTRRWCSRKCYRLSRGWTEQPKKAEQPSDQVLSSRS